jgi:hypothetical protein
MYSEVKLVLDGSEKLLTRSGIPVVINARGEDVQTFR